MNEETFLKEMVNILDTEVNIDMTTTLDSVDEWDSLALINYLSAMSNYTNKRLSTDKIRNAKTIGDLYTIASE